MLKAVSAHARGCFRVEVQGKVCWKVWFIEAPVENRKTKRKEYIMMKKTMVAFVLVSIALGGSAFAIPSQLPPVTLPPGYVPGSGSTTACDFLAEIDGAASGLFGILAVAITPPPVYSATDLENLGLPIMHQAELLAMALCADDPILRAQWAANKAIADQLIVDVLQLLDIIVGPPMLDARIQALVDILNAHPELLVDPNLTLLRDTLVGLKTQLSGLLGQVTPYLSYLPLIKQQLPAFAPALTAVAGMSSEMVAVVANLLNTYLADVNSAVGQVDAAIAAFQTILPLLTPDEQVTVNGTIVVAQNLKTIVTFVIGVPAVVQIYGNTAKGATDPFSANGDYDNDGTSNLVAFQAANGNAAQFVANASGVNPFYTGKAGLPVAGLLGLAVIAGGLALGGARKLRRK